MKTFLEFITESLSHLKDYLSQNLKSNEYYFSSGKLYIEINKLNWEKVLNMIKTIERTYKYFLSSSFIDFYSEDEKMDNNEFRKDLNIIIKTIVKYSEDSDDNDDLITLQFEPYYGEKISDIPDILYHITDKSNIKDIKSKGLLPRNTNKISYHPKRVYLLKGKGDIKPLLLNRNFNVYDPIILTIDISSIKSNLNFYRDVNYPNGVFIDQRISPKYIIKYEEFQW
jgi:hypothetical protein